MDTTPTETSWFPLSIAQRSRCFVYELEPGSRGNHNNVFAARLQGPVQPEVLEAAVRRLIARHPMLRAEVSMNQGGAPCQRILAEMPFALEVVDAAGMSAEALLSRVDSDAWKPFPRGEEPRPLLRACLYVIGASEAVFLLALFSSGALVLIFRKLLRSPWFTSSVIILFTMVRSTTTAS